MNSYERMVESPSPYGSDSPTIYENLVTFESGVVGNFNRMSKTSGYTPFWLRRGYFQKAFSMIRYLIHRYQDKGAVLSEASFDVPEYETNELVTHITNTLTGQIYFQEPEDSVEYWRNLMKNRNIKIIFIFTLVSFVDTEHATWTIVDKVRKTVEYFDPQGSAFCRDYPVDWIQILKTYYQVNPHMDNRYAFIPRTYKILNIDDTCPEYGFQYLDVNYGMGASHELDKDGYCLLWSVFLLHLRLQNLKKPLKDIQVFMIKGTYQWLFDKLTKTDKSIRERIGELFRKFIRDYGLYMHNLSRF